MLDKAVHWDRLLEQLGSYLTALGVEHQAVADQLSRLRCGNYALTPDLLGSLGEKGILHLDSQGSAGDGASTPIALH